MPSSTDEQTLEQAPATAPAAQSTAAAKKEKVTGYVAVIFDMTQTVKPHTFFQLFIGGKTEAPSPSVIKIPGLPAKNSQGVLELPRSDAMELHFGTNMNIPAARWKEIEDNHPLSMNQYFDGGCFTVIKPSKTGEASGYDCFSEAHAINLVLATVSLTDLDKFGEKETRANVNLQIEQQRAFVQNHIDQRRA